MSLSSFKVDIALLSHDKRLLICCIGAEDLDGHFEDKATKKAIMHILCLAIVPLAYSLWGKLKNDKREMVSLLVFPPFHHSSIG
jgi:hypothetical protein